MLCLYFWANNHPLTPINCLYDSVSSVKRNVSSLLQVQLTSVYLHWVNFLFGVHGELWHIKNNLCRVVKNCLKFSFALPPQRLHHILKILLHIPTILPQSKIRLHDHFPVLVQAGGQSATNALVEFVGGSFGHSLKLVQVLDAEIEFTVKHHAPPFPWQSQLKDTAFPTTQSTSLPFRLSSAKWNAHWECRIP